MVKQYKGSLRIAVNEAIATGSIRRPIPGEIPRQYRNQEVDFPTMVHGNANQQSARKAQVTAPSYPALGKEVHDLVGVMTVMSETMARIENRFSEMNKRIEYLDSQNKIQTSSICAVIDALQAVAGWIRATSDEKLKAKKHVQKTVEELCEWKRKLTVNEEIFNSDTAPSILDPAQTKCINSNGTTGTGTVGADAMDEEHHSNPSQHEN